MKNGNSPKFTEESKKHGTYGKYVLLQKMGESQDDNSWTSSEGGTKKPLHMAIYVFNKLYDDMPTLEDIIKGNGAYPFTLNQCAYGWNHPMDLVDLDGEMPIPEYTVDIIKILILLNGTEQRGENL